MPLMFQFILLLLVIGVGAILLAIPLVRNNVKPNGLYGFRTRKTLSSGEIWYKANYYAGKELAAAGLVVVSLAFLLVLAWFYVGMFTEREAIGLFVLAMSVPLLVALVRSMFYLRKL